MSRPLPRRSLAVALSALLLTGGAAAVAVHGSGGGHRQAGPATPSGAAGRFLALTGAGAGQAVTVSRLAGSKAATGAGGKQPDCVSAGQKHLQTDNPVAVMSNGWCIGPAGSSVDVLRFPLGMSPTTDGSVIVSSDSGGAQGLTFVDGTTLAPTVAASPGVTPAGNLFMGVTAPAPGANTVYASGGNADRVFRFVLAGNRLVPADASEAVIFPTHNAVHGIATRAGLPNAPSQSHLDGIPVTEYPGAALLDGRYLYVAGNLSEPTSSAEPCPDGQDVCSRVSVIDTTTDTVVRRVPVGRDAYALAVVHPTPTTAYLYVSNWGDENATTARISQPYAGGTVSVVDISNPAAAAEVGHVQVGRHPTALQLSADHSTLFVANNNDDSISVVNTNLATTPNQPTVASTQSVGPIQGGLVGAHPDAFALSPDGNTLFVALSGMNAVQLLDGHTGVPLQASGNIPDDPSQYEYIPTGWYPSSLVVVPHGSGYRLWVANAKGIGPGPGPNGSVFSNGTNTNGTVQAIDLPPKGADLSRWTRDVSYYDNFAGLNVDPCGQAVDASQVVCPGGHPGGGSGLGTQPIQHVVYIVTENKTFDQYFGDINQDPTNPYAGSYNADPKWVLYGQWNTPNHHKLASAYSLGDNFFSDAEVSVTGHSYTSGATATDHNELTWEADYDQGIRGTHGNGDPLRPSVAGKQGADIQATEDEMYDPNGGFIFEDFARANAVDPAHAGTGKLSMAIYGEHTAAQSGSTLDSYKVHYAPGSGTGDPWHTGDLQYFDYCRAQLFVTGQTSTGPLGAGQDFGSPPAGFSTKSCGGEKIDPNFSLANWTATYKATGNDVMPSFIYMTLPVNHTVGTNVGSPTPQSMVADNDYALGLIVQALSNSPFWKHTVIVNTEDDTQVAGDHVSALRDYLQVSGPLAKPGPNHQRGSMPALLRTVETIFGVQPMSLFDRLAVPMHQAFLPNVPQNYDSAAYKVPTYTAVKPAVPFALVQPDAVGSGVSATMDFRTVDQLSLADEQVLNSILYAYIKGWPLRVPAGYHYQGPASGDG
ncbi:MAG TPA: beta-propeller fold lactonase family protein [Acidimicrobiales bacterium]|nr:beta-propeller fold lactonase family protein [Acidimicrobiales bacterium]